MTNTSNKTQPQANNSILLANKLGKAMLEAFQEVDPMTLSQSIAELKRCASKSPQFKARSKPDQKVMRYDATVLEELMYSMHMIIYSHDSQVAHYRQQSILNSTRVQEFLSSIIG